MNEHIEYWGYGSRVVGFTIWHCPRCGAEFVTGRHRCNCGAKTKSKAISVSESLMSKRR